MQDPLLFFVVKIATQFKNSLRSCQKNFRRFGRQATDMRPHILSGKQRVCATNPKTLFWLACLEGNFPSTFSVASLDCWVEIKKAIVIKRLLFCYLFCGLLFLKSSKRFCKASFVSVSISFSFSTYSFPNQSGSSFAFRF